MQKHTLLARSRRGLLPFLGLSLVGLVEPTLAGVYQASSDVSLLDEAGGVAGIQFSLPKYSGPESIVGVTLTLSGSADGSVFQNYFVEDGLTTAPFAAISNVLVFGPPVLSGGGTGEILRVSTGLSYPGFSIPPCPECGFGPAEADTPFFSANFLGSIDLTDFSDFAGSGTNDFVFAIYAEIGETIYASGTVTETIFTSVPESSTWAMMLIGFASLGYVGRRARRSTFAA